MKRGVVGTIGGWELRGLGWRGNGDEGLGEGCFFFLERNLAPVEVEVEDWWCSMGREEKDGGFECACFCQWFKDLVPGVERLGDDGVAFFLRYFLRLDMVSCVLSRNYMAVSLVSCPASRMLSTLVLRWRRAHLRDSFDLPWRGHPLAIELYCPVQCKVHPDPVSAAGHA